MAIWTNIENAIQQWVKTATGFDDAHVYWDDQNVSRTDDGQPFVTLHMGEIIPRGQDERTGADNSDGTPGVDDYKLTTRGTREFSVLVQAFAPPASGYTGAPAGDGSARALLSKIQTYLSTDTVMAIFNAGGFSCFDTGTVQNITQLVGTVFEGRAALSPRFLAREVVEELTTYIETVNPVTGTYTEPGE